MPENCIYIRKADGNTYWIVNELGMEDYLCGVVPGEMPASFAPEALKAQAVCARTYAALQVLGTAYEMYHADVDDTTDCQVYLPENANAAATEAVCMLPPDKFLPGRG
ncbi:MAG: SpoIID/LytB domain-containing protein [Eubacterium sp.]